jgi:hypothetical protein
MRAPDVGFPQMVENDGELEGLYRFIGRGRASPKGVLAPHIWRPWSECDRCRARAGGS